MKENPFYGGGSSPSLDRKKFEGYIGWGKGGGTFGRKGKRGVLSDKPAVWGKERTCRHGGGMTWNQRARCGSGLAPQDAFWRRKWLKNSHTRKREGLPIKGKGVDGE